jgi:hypothetical protein
VVAEGMLEVRGGVVLSDDHHRKRLSPRNSSALIHLIHHHHHHHHRHHHHLTSSAASSCLHQAYRAFRLHGRLDPFVAQLQGLAIGEEAGHQQHRHQHQHQHHQQWGREQGQQQPQQQQQQQQQQGPELGLGFEFGTELSSPSSSSSPSSPPPDFLNVIASLRLDAVRARSTRPRVYACAPCGGDESVLIYKHDEFEDSSPSFPPLNPHPHNHSNCLTTNDQRTQNTT